MVVSLSPTPSPRCDEQEARTRAADVVRRDAGPPVRTPPDPATPDVAPPLDRLRLLLEAASTLEICDDAGWRRLRDDVQETIGELIAERALPDRLAVRHDEPAVVVRRTIAAAWRHATR
jgi:hypothetical protein